MSGLESALAYAESRCWTEAQAKSLERNFGVLKAAYASFVVGFFNLLFITLGTKYEERIVLAAYSGYFVLTALAFYNIRSRAYDRYIGAGQQPGQASLTATQTAGGHVTDSASRAVATRLPEAANAVEMVVMGEDASRDQGALLTATEEAVGSGGDSAAKQRVMNFLDAYNNNSAANQIGLKDLGAQWAFMSLLYVINAAATDESIYYHKALSNLLSGVLVTLWARCCCYSQPSFSRPGVEEAFKRQHTYLKSAQRLVRFLLWAPTEVAKAAVSCCKPGRGASI